MNVGELTEQRAKLNTKVPLLRGHPKEPEGGMNLKNDNSGGIKYLIF